MKKLLIWTLALVLLALPVIGLNLTDGAIIYYSLDNSTTNTTHTQDSTASVNNGIFTASATIGQSGILAQAVLFNQAGKVTSTSVTGISGTEPRTINFWFKQTNAAGGQWPVCIGTIAGTSAFGCYIAGGVLYPMATTDYNSGGTITANSWHMITLMYNGTHLSSYINGTETPTSDQAKTPTTTDTVFKAGGRCDNDVGSGAIGIMDELVVYNRSLSDAEITELWNSGLGFNPFIIPDPYNYINLSSPFPANESAFNFLPISFNVTGNFTLSSDCFLFINDTLNQSVAVSSGVNQDALFTVANLSKGVYTYYITCNTTNASVNTSANEFVFDLVSPDINTDFVNNSFYFNNNLTAVINLSDDVLLHGFNVSIDGVTLFNISHIHSAFYQYNLSENSTNYSVGKHILTLWASDGHTASKLKASSDYNPSVGKELGYDIKGKYKPVSIKIGNVKKDSGDKWSVIPSHDRFMEVYEPSNPKESMTFFVESDNDVYFAQNGALYGGGWLIIGDHWKDFVLVDEPDAKLSFNKKNNKGYEVTVSGLLHPEKLVFSSTGDLNINEVNYTFYVVNMSESYDSFVYSGFSTSLSLDVFFGSLGASLLSLTPVALLEWDGVNYSTTLNTFNSSVASFSRSVVPSFVGVDPFSELISHRWFFNFSTLTSGFLVTDTQTQNNTDVLLGICNSSLTFPVLNISYFDEITGLPLNVSNNYNLNITDGTFTYYLNGSFSSNTSSPLCTNINPGNTTYNWEMFGSFTMSAPNYITRIFSISESSPTLISNNPMAELSLFLIAVNDSSTVTFTWQTTEFQNIEGTMEVYKCNNDSSRSLVESLPIIGGQAIANLQLLFTAYSYEIVLSDGRRFNNEDFTTCHIESTTSRQFYIDIQSVIVLPVIGLFMIDCVLENTSATTAKMTWNANSQDSGLITGCIVGKRQDIYGLTEVYRNCTNQSSGSFEVSIPALGTTYFVSGELTQNGRKGFCRNTLSYFDGNDTTRLFGLSAVLCVVFLIISLALMYAGDGEKQVIAGAIGLLASWFLGVIVFPWELMSLAIFFLAIIVLVGRYTKQQPVG